VHRDRDVTIAGTNCRQPDDDSSVSPKKISRMNKNESFVLGRNSWQFKQLKSLENFRGHGCFWGVYGYV